eukprot:TRINITY_DN1866_c0_g1_i1.p1 TRINITY_DN1866_c0_g1~~TRINITY_DN1866_c0_g1_i1.p1  ORF type:complete len:436 (-),score=71.73 TRINITY_DN1866_c0_g1_i1:168-1475(-)
MFNSNAKVSAAAVAGISSEGASPVTPQWLYEKELQATSPLHNVSFAELQAAAGYLSQPVQAVQGGIPLGNTYSLPVGQVVPPANIFRNPSLSPGMQGMDVRNVRGPWNVRPVVPANTFHQANYYTTTNVMGYSSPGAYPSGTFPSPSPSAIPRPIPTRSYSSTRDVPPNFYTNPSTLPPISPLIQPTHSGFFNNAPVPPPVPTTSKKESTPKDPRKARQQEQLSANKERTVYVSEVDHNVTEADIAMLFSRCGDVVDCRLCGDAHSRMRFAFVEFSQDTWKFAVPEALKLNSTLLGTSPIRVQRSRTAIVPVKKELLPQSEEEIERCTRTIYASNIDKRFNQSDVVTFFEALAVDEETGADGKVSRVKLFGDGVHNTAIAFLEFYTPESANAALNKCQGALMGCLPLRVSPSKTPIRTAEEEKALRESQRVSGRQ